MDCILFTVLEKNTNEIYKSHMDEIFKSIQTGLIVDFKKKIAAELQTNPNYEKKCCPKQIFASFSTFLSKNISNIDLPLTTILERLRELQKDDLVFKEHLITSFKREIHEKLIQDFEKVFAYACSIQSDKTIVIKAEIKKRTDLKLSASSMKTLGIFETKFIDQKNHLLNKAKMVFEVEIQEYNKYIQPQIATRWQRYITVIITNLVTAVIPTEQSDTKNPIIQSIIAKLMENLGDDHALDIIKILIGKSISNKKYNFAISEILEKNSKKRERSDDTIEFPLKKRIQISL